MLTDRDGLAFSTGSETAPPGSSPEDGDLLAKLRGSWRILTCRTVMCDTGEQVEPLGPNPIGSMVLADTGRVMFVFMASDRPEPGSDADRGRLFDKMTAYTGWVQADGAGRFVADVDIAWHPGFLGQQHRFYELDGDRLRVWTPEQTHPRFGGRLVVSEVVWTRERRATTHPDDVEWLSSTSPRSA